MARPSTSPPQSTDAEPVDHAPMSKGERTRQRLVDAARVRFARDEFRAVSVSAVAKDVGITPAAVYTHFTNKDALFAAALDADVAAWVADGTPAEPTDRPVADHFARLIDGLDRFALVARTLRTGSGEHLRLIQRSDAISGLTDAIRDEIERRQAAGVASTRHPAGVLATGVETIVFGLFTTIVRTGLTGDADRLAGVLAIFDAALGHPSQPQTPRETT